MIMRAKMSFPTSEFEMDMNENNRNETWRSNSSYELLDGEFCSNVESVPVDIQQVARGISLIIFVALGFVLNTFLIISIVPNKRLRTVRNILLVHLGCTGLLLSFFINLTTAIFSFTGHWFGGAVICQIYGYLLSVLTLVTSWTICALSWDKYQTIASPLHHSFTAKAVKMAACFSVFWAVACALSLPPMFGGNRYVFHPRTGICFFCLNPITRNIYMISYLLAGIYIPLGIMLFCYSQIYRIARTQSSRIGATMVQMTRVIQVTIAPGSQTSSLSVKRTRAVCTILQLIGAFVVVYVPMSVMLLTEILSSKEFEENDSFSSLVQMLFLSAPVIHSAVYGVRNKILRISFRRYIRIKIRYCCYKEKRQNSIKSFKSIHSSSFKLNLVQKNGGTLGIRRTQSFPTRGCRKTVRFNTREVRKSRNDGLKAGAIDSFLRPRSYSFLNRTKQLHVQHSGEIRDVQEIA